MNSTRIGWIVAATLVSGAAAWTAITFRGASAPGPVQGATLAISAPGNASGHCRFAPGATLAYRLGATVEEGGSGHEDEFRAVLSLQVEMLKGDTARLHGALSSVHLEQSLTAKKDRLTEPLTGGFVMEVDQKTCAFQCFGFHPDSHPRTRKYVRTLLQEHEYIVDPGAPVGGRWEESQRDGVGEFEARYERRPSRAGFRVTRQKRRKEDASMERTFGFAVRSSGSVAAAMFRAGQPWLATSQGREQHVIVQKGKTSARLKQRFSLRRDDTAFVKVPDLNADQLDYRDAFDLEEAPAERQRIARRSKTFQEAWARFEKAMGAGNVHDAAYDLGAWLSEHPEGVAQVQRAIRGGRLSTHASAAAFLALELADNDAARGALISLMDDGELEELDRARAASALADMKTPTRAAAMALTASAAADDEMVSTVSLLGLGSMSDRVGRGEFQDDLISTLDGAWTSAETDARRRVVLDAMGNSAQPAVAPTLTAAFQDESPLTRKHAATALAHLPKEVASAPLLDQLAVETDPAVSKAVVRALDDLGVHPASSVDTFAERLRASKSPQERAELIRWLAGVPEGGGTATLVAHFHQERNPQLQALIGRYVPASALQ